MKIISKRAGFTLLTLVILLFSSVSVFANDNSNSAEPLQGMEGFLSFALLLFMIVAPAFKKRERTMFLSNNNELFTI